MTRRTLQLSLVLVTVSLGGLVQTSCISKVTAVPCDDGTFCPDGFRCVARTVDNNTYFSCAQATCGNGVQEPGEACDNGPANSDQPNACRPDCTLPRCGDGIYDDVTEECDDGNDVETDDCLPN